MSHSIRRDRAARASFVVLAAVVCTATATTTLLHAAPGDELAGPGPAAGAAVREGLYVFEAARVAEPDSEACRHKSTICVRKVDGRLVGTMARRSPVLERNAVPPATRKFDLAQATLEGTLVVILPFENTACKEPLLRPVPAKGELVEAGPQGPTLAIQYERLLRDAVTCETVGAGLATDRYFKSTSGDAACSRR